MFVKFETNLNFILTAGYGIVLSAGTTVMVMKLFDYETELTAIGNTNDNNNNALMYTR